MSGGSWLIGHDERLSYDLTRMLTPPTSTTNASPNRTRISRSRTAVRLNGPRPASPLLRQWLEATGSLTARLRLLGTVRVEVIDQGRRQLWPQEMRALRCTVGHVREVVLRVDGRAAVWARSSVPAHAVKGPWKAIRGLGTRPLAELLFSNRTVRRGPLQSMRFRPHSLPKSHMARQWSSLGCTARLHEDVVEKWVPTWTPSWARHSLFFHHNHPLQVLEAFAPWVTKRSCRKR
jgi:chorismate--pyruvate lyase